MNLTIRLNSIVPSIFLALLCATSAQGQGPASKPSDAQVLTWLKALKPLPKVHYSWPIAEDLLNHPNEPRLLEFARVTHAISLRAETLTARQLEVAVIICKYINATAPAIPTTLALNYSPWHRQFGDRLPPTDVGPSHHAEINVFAEKLARAAEMLASANVRHKCDIRISALLLDTERFHTKADDSVWNKAMTEKYAATYETARRILPKARIEWYERGAWMPFASSTGWGQASWFTLEEPGETFSCPLYRVPEIGYTRETFRRTVENAAKHGVKEVTPWIALGCGYRRSVREFQEWSKEWNYDLIYSWHLGLELNNSWYGDRPERFAPWHAAKVVIFYPAPFAREYPFWLRHFVAYVRGATQIHELP